MHENYYGSAFVFSQAAWMIPMASGTLSAISSILIISIILRSSRESRFSSYHIIMLFMSFWDAIASIAIAFTTIPMPSDVHEVYPFKGKAYGNVGTCEAQGFLILLGTFFAVSANCALNVYYLCAIRYGMTEEKIKRKVLPLMLVLATSLCLPIPLRTLEKDKINPRPFTNFCAASKYPAWCQSDEDTAEEKGSVECMRGGIIRLFGKIYSLAFLCGCFFIIFVSLFLVVLTAFETEQEMRRMRRIYRQERRHTRPRNPPPEDEFKRTRVVLLQACMYIAAFLLTWGCGFILTLAARGQEDPVLDAHTILVIGNLTFRPLQGFFNALIFIYQKAYSLREANRELRFSNAVMQVIVSPSVVPALLISGIEITEDYAEEPQNQLIRQGGDLLRAEAENAAHQEQVAPNNIEDAEEIDKASVAALSDDGEANRESSLESLSVPSVGPTGRGSSMSYSGATTWLESVAEGNEDDFHDEDTSDSGAEVAE